MIPILNIFRRRIGVSTLWLLCCAVVICTLGFMSNVYAQPGSSGTAGDEIEIDANFHSGILPAGALYSVADDWSQGPTGLPLLLQSAGVSISGYNPVAPGTDAHSRWYVDANWGAGADTTQFTGSNKNGDFIDAASTKWEWGGLGSGGPQKNDITNTYTHSRLIGTQRWIAFGFETRATNGTSYVDFEFNQKGIKQIFTTPTSGKLTGNGLLGGRTVGDVLMVINYEKGGQVPIAEVRYWTSVGGGSWSAPIEPPAGAIFMTTNNLPVPSVAPNMGVAPNGTPTNTTIAYQVDTCIKWKQSTSICSSEWCC